MKIYVRNLSQPISLPFFVTEAQTLPKLTFLSLKDLPGQDANGIMSAIIEAFNDVQMPFLKDKLVYLASDGATVNSGTKAGLAVNFREAGALWLVFVWCMSHRIELALKDSLDDAIQPTKKSLTALFYCYEKSSKKLRELRKLHKVLSELYEFEDGRVNPSKCSGTRWIAHVLRSMSGLIDKFRLYLQHYETIISDTTKKTDKATFEGKRKQLTDANILLRPALFIDLLQPAKKFSILSQREAFNIIDMVDCLDDMLLSYQIRKRNIDNDPDIVYSFSTVEKLLKYIKITTSENRTLAYQYQDVKIDYFQREKTNLSKSAASFIDQILDAANNRFEGITSEEPNVEGMPTAGDAVLHVCTVLDTRKWILPESMAISEPDLTCLFEKNIEALKRVFLHFEDILVKTFPGINALSVEEEFILVVSHAMKHFNTQIHPPLALWQYLYGIRESKSWLNIFRCD